MEESTVKKEDLKGESTLKEENLYDIYFLFKAPKATEKQDLSKIIKIVFSYSDGSTGNTIALNVEEDGIYIKPSVQSIGVRATKGIKKIDDMEKVVEIFDKYNVQDWKEDYSVEDPSSYEDGIGWNLWFQYKDGTVQSSRGSGTGLESITPEEFDDFFNELSDFVDERLEGNDD